MGLTIDPSGLRPTQLLPPPSKSDAHRALVLGHICGLPLPDELSEAHGLPRDVAILRDGLSQLGEASAGWREINCQDAGAPFRFLLGQASILSGTHIRFFGTERLGQRPHRALIDALRAALGRHGLLIEQANGWPLNVTGATGSGEPHFKIAAAESSQHVSSLLFAAAALYLREHRPWTVELIGETTSEGYLALTLEWLTRAGFAVRQSSRKLEISDYKKKASLGPVPGDWSSIAYLLAIAWRTQGTVARVDPGAEHPDRVVLEMLKSVGLRVHISESHEAAVDGVAINGLNASAKHCPDLIPTLAALACVLPKPSVFSQVAILKRKESDRLEATLDLVRAFGHRGVVEDDALTVIPRSTRTGGRTGDAGRTAKLSTRGDHRMAMSAATLSVLSATPVEIDDATCVSKSFPQFWDELAKAGISLKTG